MTGSLSNPAEVSQIIMNNAWQLLVGIFVGIWILSVIRVSKDITNRTNNSRLQIFSIILVTVCTPIVGLPVYWIIRPLNYKSDRLKWREALALKTINCYECGKSNLKNYDYCVFCGSELKAKCKECKNEYPFSHAFCYKCGAPNVQ